MERVYWHSLDSSLDLCSESTHLIATSIRLNRQVRMSQEKTHKLHDSEKVHCNGSYNVFVLITGQLKRLHDKCPCRCWSCQRANECSWWPEQNKWQEKEKVTVSEKCKWPAQLIPHSKFGTWLLIGSKKTNKLIYLKVVPFRSTSIDDNQRKQKTVELNCEVNTNLILNKKALLCLVQLRGKLSSWLLCRLLLLSYCQSCINLLSHNISKEKTNANTAIIYLTIMQGEQLMAHKNSPGRNEENVTNC